MSDTGWRLRGAPELFFGRMFEDPQVELAAFRPNSRIFCIASAGCTAITLANAGYRVVAADLNPAQTAYVRERLEGAEPRPGKIDGKLRRGLQLAGKRAERERFCAMTDPAEQVDYWRNYLESPMLRLLLRAATHPILLRRFYSEQVLASVPPRFDRQILLRLIRGFGTYPNATNPFIRAYFLGDLSPVRYRSGEIELVTSGAAEYLESVPAASFDGFTLSNIFDGAGPEYSARLLRAVRHAATPEAVTVIRRFAGSGGLDRSLIWGSLEIDANTHLRTTGVGSIREA